MKHLFVSVSKQFLLHRITGKTEIVYEKHSTMRVGAQEISYKFAFLVGLPYLVSYPKPVGCALRGVQTLEPDCLECEVLLYSLLEKHSHSYL